MSTIPDILKECRSQMGRAIDSTKREFNSVRSGKASPSMLDTVRVALYGAQVSHMMRLAAVGALPWGAVLGSAMPFLGVLWTLSLLVATLATVGVFLRLRTASLSEIQLRLAALEEMLSSQPRLSRPDDT